MVNCLNSDWSFVGLQFSSSLIHDWGILGPGLMGLTHSVLLTSLCNWFVFKLMIVTTGWSSWSVLKYQLLLGGLSFFSILSVIGALKDRYCGWLFLVTDIFTTVCELMRGWKWSIRLLSDSLKQHFAILDQFISFVEWLRHLNVGQISFTLVTYWRNGSSTVESASAIRILTLAIRRNLRNWLVTRVARSLTWLNWWHPLAIWWYTSIHTRSLRAKPIGCSFWLVFACFTNSRYRRFHVGHHLIHMVPSKSIAIVSFVVV